MYSTNTWNISRIKFMRLKVFLFIHTETQCLRHLEDKKCICALNPCVFGLKVKRSEREFKRTSNHTHTTHDIDKTIN